MSVGAVASRHGDGRARGAAHIADITHIAARRGVHLSVVVPICNEEDELRCMAEGLAPQLDEIAGPGRWQFVLVDNGSTDAYDPVNEESHQFFALRSVGRVRGLCCCGFRGRKAFSVTEPKPGCCGYRPT